jgi:hypothetical protein
MITSDSMFRSAFESWVPQDIVDLEFCAKIGDTLSETAAFLKRDEEEVRRKANELRLSFPEDQPTSGI